MFKSLKEQKKEPPISSLFCVLYMFKALPLIPNLKVIIFIDDKCEIVVSHLLHMKKTLLVDLNL